MQQNDSFLHRSYVGALGNQIRWLPHAFPSSGRDDSDPSTFKFFAYSSWSDMEQADSLTLASLEIVSRGSRARSSESKNLGHLDSDYALTDFQVVELSKNGKLLFVCATSQGHLTKATVQLPANERRLRDSSNENLGTLQPWLDLHAGAVTAVDVSSDMQHVLTAGEDGSLCVVPLSAVDASTVRRLKQAGSGSSYVSARWAGGSAIVAVPAGGGLELWDVRQGSRPSSSRTPQAWGLTGCPASEHLRGPEMRITSASVHPSRPNTCATGSTGGCIAVWDLRFDRAPLAHSLPQGPASDVWQVKFECGEAFASTREGSPTPLLFSTEAGLLGRAAYQADIAQFGSVDGWSVQPLCKEAFAITAFDIEPSAGREVVGLTDQECVLFLQRPLPGADALEEDEDEMMDDGMAAYLEERPVRGRLMVAAR